MKKELEIDKELVSVDVEDISTLTAEQFAAVRSRNCIGGSSAGQSVGLGKWGTATELYDRLRAIKLGQQPPEEPVDPAKALLFESGHMAEDNIALRLKAWFKVYYSLDLDIYEDTRMFRSKVYPWATANVDRWGVIHHPDGNDETVLIEIKTVSSSNYDAIQNWKDGVVNQQYLCQVLHYMGVVRLSGGAHVGRTLIVGAWGMGIDPSSMAVISIPYTEEGEKILFDGERKFWNAVETGTNPDWGEEDKKLLLSYLARKYGLPGEKLPAKRMSNAAIATVKRLVDIDSRLKEIEKEKKALEAEKAETASTLLPEFLTPDGQQLATDCCIMSGGGKKVTVTYKVSKTRSDYAWDRIQKDIPEAEKACRDVKYSTAKFKEWCTANGVDPTLYEVPQTLSKSNNGISFGVKVTDE